MYCWYNLFSDVQFAQERFDTSKQKDCFKVLKNEEKN